MDEVIEDSSVALEGDLKKLTAAEWRQLRIRRVRPESAVLAVANKKGGSRKTTTCVQLAAAFAAWGARVRLTDGDPQGASATYWMLPQAEGWRQRTLLEVFEGDLSLDEATTASSIPGVSIIPSLDTLEKLDFKPPPGAETVLREAYEEAEEVDLDIGDAAPSIRTVTVALLVAATHLVIPMNVSDMDFFGSAELRKPLKLVRKRLNPDLRTAAVVLTGSDDRTLLSQELQQQIQVDYPDSLMATVPYSVRVGEVSRTHQSLLDYAPDNPVTLAYYRLAAALVSELGFEWVIGPRDVLKLEAK